MKLSITNNFSIKILALCLGFLLWLHVATEKEYTYERTLPVTGIALAEGLEVDGKPVDSLTVSVTGSGKQLLRQQWRKRGLRISASHLQAGEHELELTPANVTLNGDAQGLLIRGVVRPTHLMLNIDQRATRTIPVEVDITPTAAAGHAVTRVLEPEPKEVQVTGPEGELKKLGAVKTISRTVEGLRDTAHFILPLNREEYAGLRIVPDSVAVTVCVEAMKKKSLKQVPIAVFHPADGKEIKHRPVTVDIEVSGAASLIESLEAHQIAASVDYTGRNQASHRAPIRVDCPSGISVASLSIDSVQFSK